MTQEDTTTHDPHDVRQGVDWWNGLSPQEREQWLEMAGSAIPADAWELFKQQNREGRGHD